VIRNITQSGNDITARVTCPLLTGYMVAYDEGDWENWPWQLGNNLAGILFTPTTTSDLRAVRTIFTPTTATDQLTGYTIRIWEGFNLGTGWPNLMVHSQSGMVNWAASLRTYGWVTIPLKTNTPVQCDSGKIYYIEIEYQGIGYLISSDCGLYSYSPISGNSYVRQDLNSPCSPMTWGDWNIRAIFTQSTADSIPDSSTVIAREIGKQPDAFLVYPNYPNPFNGMTRMGFRLPKSDQVSVKVYNSSGQRVETLLNQRFQAGEHEIVWNATDLSSGIYFYQVRSGPYSAVGKCLLLK